MIRAGRNGAEIKNAVSTEAARIGLPEEHALNTAGAILTQVMERRHG